jgi:Ca2+-binding RTX toxin-like protein
VDGGAGEDRLIAGQGGRDVFIGGQGLDTLVLDWSTFTTAATLESALKASAGGGDDGVYVNASGQRVAFFGVEAFVLTGGSAADSFFTGAGGDFLEGRGGDDRLESGAGNDRLDGGGGGDTMIGGTGDDVYLVDSFRDVVIELAGEGVDEVRTAIGSRTDLTRLYVMPGHVENLTGTAADGQGVRGNGLDNVIVLGAGNDFVLLNDGGDDTVFGGAGDDRFVIQGALTSADRINGGAGLDTVNLEGNYDLTLEAATFESVENLRITSFAATDHNYRITTADETVEAGANLRVDARDLGAGESLTFDGSRETDGTFFFLGGAGKDMLTGGAGNDQFYGFGGDDVLIGGGGADQLRGGFGSDIFRFDSLEDSTVAAPDRIADFNKGSDKIDLTRIDANANVEGDQAFSFIGDAAFTRNAGELRSSFDAQANAYRVEGDVDGDGNADFAILVVVPGQMPLVASDFML